uniref:Uncharacterized protein n=1 Tax=Arundo donax TaxID=35708 RepID=A0A0A9DC07_ARUDO
MSLTRSSHRASSHESMGLRLPLVSALRRRPLFLAPAGPASSSRRGRGSRAAANRWSARLPPSCAAPASSPTEAGGILSPAAVDGRGASSLML